MSTEEMTADLIDKLAAWSDYRSAYGASGSAEFLAFKAGWDAARGMEHNDVQR